jgi:CubicO group peptidase (beta-lactamase class C family)
MIKKNLKLLLGIFLILIIGASGFSQNNRKYIYRKPQQLDDGWRVSSLSDAGLNEGLITQMTQRIIEGKFRGIHSVIIVKNGALVHEAYFQAYNRDSLHKIHSITKSITSALIGIAIEEGFIKGIDEPIYPFFPQYPRAFEDPRKRTIKLKHILTLTSGLEWDERSYPYSDPRNSEYQQVASDDWMDYVLQRPIKDEPGVKWVYNTGSVHLLSAVIKTSTGLYAKEYAQKYLFGPLGIKKFDWNQDPQGYQCTGGTHGGLRMRTRDVAKFGYIFLNEGNWNGKQVVSKDWVKESTQKHLMTQGNRGLGYLWWRDSFVIKGKKINYFYAAGYGGQSITIAPELDLMMVFTCWTRAQDAAILGPMLMIYNAALGD